MNNDLRDISKIKRATGLSITDIRLVFSAMKNNPDDTIEVIQRFRSQGYTDIKKLLKENYSEGPPLTQKHIKEVENKIGYKLPSQLFELYTQKNGVYFEGAYFPVNESNSWSNDHICIECLFGIGTEMGIEQINQKAFRTDWGYPDIGLVIGDTPSSMHAVIMLDYRHYSNPSVVFVDTPRRHHNAKIIHLANNFESFYKSIQSFST